MITDLLLPTVLSVRLNAQEHTQLVALADGMPLSTYLKEAVLKQGMRPSPKAPPLIDRQAQGQILAKLGELETSRILADLSLATASSSLPEIQSVSQSAQDACEAIFWMRDQLIASQGLKVHAGRVH